MEEKGNGAADGGIGVLDGLVGLEAFGCWDEEGLLATGADAGLFVVGVPLAGVVVGVSVVVPGVVVGVVVPGAVVVMHSIGIFGQ